LNKSNSWFFLSIILLLSILLRIPNLNESLWYDEVNYSTYVWLENPLRLLKIVAWDPAAPFYRAFMFLWIRLFSDSELSVRMVPLLCGILSILLTYILASRLFERKTAFLASFLLSISPVHIWYSQEATPYSMTLFLLLLSLFSYYKLQESEINNKWYFIYFGSLFLAIFSHWFAFSYLVSISLSCLFKINKAKRNILILNCLVFGCLVIFWALKILVGYSWWGFYLRPFTLFELWMLFFNWFSFGNSIWSPNYGTKLKGLLQKPDLLISQILFFFIFVRGLFLSLKESKNIYKFDVFLYVFLLPFFALGVSLFYKHIYQERYLFIVLPFFYIILSKGATSFKSQIIRLASVSAISLFAIIALFGYFLKPEESTVYKHNPDWSSGAQFLENDSIGINGQIFAITSAPVEPLMYYMQRLERKSSERRVDGIHFISDFPQSICKGFQEDRACVVYLIKEIVWPENFEACLKEFKEKKDFALVKTEKIKGLEIYKFKKYSQSADH
jgi:4-amino-4-deoxy-L-arabinose transferase-like glycosyltransferase